MSSDSGSGGRYYRVPDWIRVRRESFGLLFYDTRATKLTYVRSGDSLDPPPFTGSCRRLAVDAPGGVPIALSRALQDLVAKGLIIDETTE